MLTAYDDRFRRVDDLGAATWIDVLDPTEAENAAVQAATGLHVASRAELSEIESSSRLGSEDGALFLSMPLAIHVYADDAHSSPLGFVLTRDRLLTIRFETSRAFDAFVQQATRGEMQGHGGPHVFVALLELIVDRLADVLEHIRDNLDGSSRLIFTSTMATGRRPRAEDKMLRALLTTIGRNGDLISEIRDSLLGIARIVPFTEHLGAAWLDQDLHERLRTVRQDVASLSGYDAHLTNKLQFLLDATLGFINIAQNNIIKVLTVVSVVGIPPTLVASIYGMNFKSMPELNWAFGYPYGLAMIVLTAILPLVVFRIRGWI
jgi:magnesium transporter